MTGLRAVGHVVAVGALEGCGFGARAAERRISRSATGDSHVDDGSRKLWCEIEVSLRMRPLYRLGLFALPHVRRGKLSPSP